jgi:AraC-like DNA-binding protein
MAEYISVYETARAWGISERRVHKLCGEGRIEGLIRLGNTWGIPREAKKPADGRTKHSEDKVTDESTGNRIFGDCIGSDTRLSFQKDGCAVYQLENETGNGVVAIYNVFPGILLFYNDLHMSSITDYNSGSIANGEDIMEIKHCREGRYECEFQSGECAYLGEGDLSANTMSEGLKSSHFPLTHYHGVSIRIDMPRASKTIKDVSAVLGIVPVDLHALKNRLLANRPYFIIRGTESVEHIFSELYHAPDALKESYIKLKVLELLMFLSVQELKEPTSRRYFYKSRVNAAKAMHHYMTTHLDEQFTLQSLSERFGIPLTAMKSCFKSVFGTPIQSYIREYRLHAAAVMLRETDESIANIAAKVGYDSHAKFSSAFKSFMDISPTDYRRIAVQKE